MCHFLAFLALPESGNVDKVTGMRSWARFAKRLGAVGALCMAAWPAAIPAGTLIEIRLQQEINSHLEMAAQISVARFISAIDSIELLSLEFHP